VEKPHVTHQPSARSKKTRAEPSGAAGHNRAHELLNQAAHLLRQGEVEEALDLLELAHSLDSTSVPILLTFGAAYLLAGRHRHAIPLLEAARDAEPDSVMVWTNLGAAYLGNPVLATPEQQSLAIAAFEQALALDPEAPSVHYNLGLIYVDRGEFEQALQAFRRAIQSNQDDRDAQLWLRRLAGPAVETESQEFEE
jgi:tetratricopeptide (TPR) repeat protein